MRELVVAVLGEKIGGVFIAQMTAFSVNTHFQKIRIVVLFQHLLVVVRFNDKDICFSEISGLFLFYMSEVGGNHKVFVVVSDVVAHIVVSVVWHIKSFHRELIQLYGFLFLDKCASVV